MITRKLCFFWAQGENAAPDFVRRCWDAWASLNPAWDVTIHDDQDATEAFSECGIVHPPQTFQGRADIFRIWKVARDGGLYVDAATVPLRPLDDWLPLQAAEGFFAYHDPYRRRSIENWLIHAEPGNLIARRWLETVVDYWAVPRRLQKSPSELDRGIKGALASRLAPLTRPPKHKQVIEPRNRLWSVSPEGGARRPVHPYFWPHYLFDRLLQTDPEVRAAWAGMPKTTSYKQLMLRHHKNRYAQMSDTEFCSYAQGAEMQKLALKRLPDSHQLDLLFSLARGDLPSSEG